MVRREPHVVVVAGDQHPLEAELAARGSAPARAPGRRGPRGAATGAPSSRCGRPPRAATASARAAARGSPTTSSPVGDPEVVAVHACPRAAAPPGRLRAAATPRTPRSRPRVTSTAPRSPTPGAVRVLVAELEHRLRPGLVPPDVGGHQPVGSIGRRGHRAPFHQPGSRTPPGIRAELEHVLDCRACPTTCTRTSPAEEIERQRGLYGPLAQSVRELADAVDPHRGRRRRDPRAPRPRSRRSPSGCASASSRASYGVRFSAAGQRPGLGQRGRRPAQPGRPAAGGRARRRPAGRGRTSASARPTRARPGLVHGGVSALILDQLLGEAAGAGGKPGMTGTLTLRYRRAHPARRPARRGADRPGRGHQDLRGRPRSRTPRASRSRPRACSSCRRWAREPARGGPDEAGRVRFE